MFPSRVDSRRWKLEGSSLFFLANDSATSHEGNPLSFLIFRCGNPMSLQKLEFLLGWWLTRVDTFEQVQQSNPLICFLSLVHFI